MKGVSSSGKLSIDSQLNKQISHQREILKNGILSIIDVILALGQRGLGFRGNWSKDKKEDGNYSFFVKRKSQFDQNLKEHLLKSPLNAKYLSPDSQNEIIKIIERIIRRQIIGSIPKYWSLMLDETEDEASNEQLSVCVR